MSREVVKHKAPHCPWGLSSGALCIALLAFAGTAFAHGDAPEHLPSAQTSSDDIIVKSSGVLPASQPALTGSSGIAVSPVIPKAEQRTDAGQYGRWSDVVNWPVLAVHAALLPNGRVMAWDATPDDFDDDPHTTDSFTTRVTVWNPVTGRHLATPNDTNADLFCAGSAHLWDGRILFAGGDSGREGRNGPLSNSSLYDPWSNTWSQSDSMAAPRWYSSVAALSNGELLTFGGTYSPRPIAEVFKFNQQWRDLPLRVPFTVSGDYSWLQATSSGDVMYLGPHNTLSTVSTEADGHWSPGPERDTEPYRGYGSYALFDVDKALVVGGGPSSTSSVIVDMATQQTTPTAPVLIGRRQHNLTVLADGSVLATGGNATGATFVDMNSQVLTPEIWRADTGLWQPMADMARTRQYHSVALLLPDGRVLSAGGGYCAVCGEVGYHEQNAEIFSPPYLFDDNGGLATRPTLINVPEQVNYGTRFVVKTNTATAAAKVTRAHLIKLGSVTHSQNQDQRLVPVAVQQLGGKLQITAPVSREIAPPGHYLLFVVDANGTPSIGKIIQVGQPLISANEVVVNRVRQDRWDYYAIEATGDHALTVHLQGSLENVDLMVSAGRYPTLLDAEEKQFDCASNTHQVGGKLCVVRASSDTTWYIGVYGQQRADYSLVAHIDASEALSGIPEIQPSSAPGSQSVPGTPVNVRAEILSATDASLYWDPPTGGNTIINYEVFRDGRLISVESSPDHQATNLQPAKRYEYQVVAVDLQQNRSAATAAFPVVTLADPNPDLDALFHPEIPSAPTDVRVIRYDDTSLEVFWEPSIDNGHITGYEISRDGVLLDIRDGVSYYDGSVQPAEHYTYSIVAVDNDRNRSQPSISTEIELPYVVRPVETAPIQGPDTIDTADLSSEDDIILPTEDASDGQPSDDDYNDYVVAKNSGGAVSAGISVILLLLYMLKHFDVRYRRAGSGTRGQSLKL